MKNENNKYIRAPVTKQHVTSRCKGGRYRYSYVTKVCVPKRKHTKNDQIACISEFNYQPGFGSIFLKKIKMIKFVKEVPVVV